MSVSCLPGCRPVGVDLGHPWVLVDHQGPADTHNPGFLIWTAVVLAWYFAYGRKHSHLGRHEHVGLIKDEQVS